MDWSNEYWIRAYIKDSPSFSKCAWQARGLFFLLARIVNAAGILVLEPNDPKVSIEHIAHKLDADWQEILPSLMQLIETQTIQIAADWSVLVIPNFVEAQSAKWEPASRKKMNRKRLKETEGAVTLQSEQTSTSVLEAMAGLVPLDLSNVGSEPGLEGADLGVQPVNQLARILVGQGVPIGKVTNTVMQPVNQLARLHVSLPEDGSKTDTAGQGSFCTLPEGGSKTDTAGQGSFCGLPTSGSKVDTTGQGSNVTLPADVPIPDIAGQGSVTLPVRVPNRSERKISDHRSYGSVAELPILGQNGSERDTGRQGSPNRQGAYVGQQQSLPLPGEPAERLDPKEEKKRRLVGLAWEHYLTRWRQHQDSDKGRKHGPVPTLNDQRAKHLAARIREVGLETVIEAINRLWDNPWRVKSGYTVIDYAIRSTSQLEKILAQDFEEVNREKAKPKGNGKHAIKQGPPSEDYVGHGGQYHSEGGKVVDQNGNTIELEDDPLGLGLTFG